VLVVMAVLVGMAVMVVMMVTRGKGRSGHGNQKDEQGKGGLLHGFIMPAVMRGGKLLTMHVTVETIQTGADGRRVLLR
jgi:hypothetical protein